MSNQADYQFILEETLAEMRERAERIQLDSPYEEGRLMAYYEILSEAINQAKVVGLEPDGIGLGGLNPDRLLKKSHVTSSRYLYHYTTGSGLYGILENQCIWASHYKTLNDYLEVSAFLITHKPQPV